MSNLDRTCDRKLQIHAMCEESSGEWDSFVESVPEATFFHRSGWKEIFEDEFGHEAYYLYATDSEEIQGILPLVHMSSRIFGKGLISLPFCAYGGIVSKTQSATELLKRRACDLAEELKVDYLEMRNVQLSDPSWPTKDLYMTFRKKISDDNEKNMAAIPRKRRAMIRKGIKANLASEIDQDVDRFFDAYSQSVRSLGTPVFSKKYFRRLKKAFGRDCELLTIVQGSKTIASVLNFYFRDQVLPYYGGGVDISRSVAGNDFMYWEVMRRASDRGCRVFDFGRSKVGTGSYQFKCLWGFEPESLHYEYFLVNATDIPNVSPANPKYKLFIAAWRRLPLSVTRILGPMVVRNLG